MKTKTHRCAFQRVLLLAVAVLGLYGAVYGQTNRLAGTNAVAAVQAEPAPELWFPVGEDLEYKLYWGFIPVARSRIVTGWTWDEGKRLLAIRVRTRSNKFIARIYPVDDRLETIVDPETFHPVLFTKDLREGDHRYHEMTRFDYTEGVARWESITKQKTRTYEITRDVRDLLTFMYYLRSQEFPQALGQQYNVVADEKIYDLTMDVDGIENVKVSHFGRVRSYEVEPKAEFQGLFVHEGKIKLWIALKDRPLITRIEVDAPLGHVKAILHLVQGPGDDFWTRKTKEYLKKEGKEEETDPEIEEALRELDAPQ